MISKFKLLLIITLVAGLYSFDNAAFAVGNFGVGGHTFGTSAEGTLGITNGTEPSTAPSDVVQLYSKDKAAGDNRLYLRSESGDKLILGNNKIETSANDLSLQPSSGNVGIGTTSPDQKLEVSGGIKIGDISGTPTAGTIRWTGTDFEGYTGTEWISLTIAIANYVKPIGISSPTLSDHNNGIFYYAIDENWNTWWNSQPDYQTWVGRKIDLEYAEAFTATKFAIKFDGSTRSNVVSMTLFGANDDMVWVQLTTGVNYSGSYIEETFNFSNSSSYNHYRVRIDSATVDTGYSNIWGIEFYRY